MYMGALLTLVNVMLIVIIYNGTAHPIHSLEYSTCLIYTSVHTLHMARPDGQVSSQSLAQPSSGCSPLSRPSLHPPDPLASPVMTSTHSEVESYSTSMLLPSTPACGVTAALWHTVTFTADSVLSNDTMQKLWARCGRTSQTLPCVLQLHVQLLRHIVTSEATITITHAYHRAPHVLCLWHSSPETKPCHTMSCLVVLAEVS